MKFKKLFLRTNSTKLNVFGTKNIFISFSKVLRKVLMFSQYIFVYHILYVYNFRLKSCTATGDQNWKSHIGGISLKRKLWQRCFPIIFVKFLKTLFFVEHLRWLLPHTTTSSFYKCRRRLLNFQTLRFGAY